MPRNRSRVTDVLVTSGLARLFGGIFAGRVGAALCQAGTLVFLARLLRPQEFAVVGGLLGVLAFSSTVIDMGVTAAATRAQAAGASNQVRRLKSLNLVGSVAIAVVLAPGLAAYAIASSSFIGVGAFSLLGVWAGVDRLAEFRLATLMGAKLGSGVAVNVAVRRALPLVFVGAAFIAWPQGAVTSLALGSIAGSVLALAVSGRPKNADPESMDDTERVHWSRGIRESFPYWVNSMSAQCRQLDVLLVGWSGGIIAASTYAPVSRLISPLRMLPTTFAQAALAVVASSKDMSTRGGGHILTLVTVGPSVALFSLIALTAEPGIEFVLGDEYSSAVPVLRVVLVGLMFAAASSMQTSILMAQGYAGAVAKVNLASACMSLLLILLGGSAGGGLGAGVGLSAGYALQAILLLALSSRVRGHPQTAVAGNVQEKPLRG